MTEPLGAELAELLGEPVVSVLPVHGGDLSDVSEVNLASGTSAIVKTGPKVATEARMLMAIGQTGCAVPKVIAVSRNMLVMEYVHTGSGRDPEALARELCKLHAATGPNYGWDEDYAFGSVEIQNAPAESWPEFWARRRLLANSEALPAEIRNRLEHLGVRLPDILPETPRPSLLHGDLWGGNILYADDGRAYLIDPACYYGDPEVDLAMLDLFGSSAEAVSECHDPLPAGWQDRRHVYQLWPALVHLRLFGPGYRGMVEKLLSAVGS